MLSNALGCTRAHLASDALQPATACFCHAILAAQPLHQLSCLASQQALEPCVGCSIGLPDERADHLTLSQICPPCYALAQVTLAGLAAVQEAYSLSLCLLTGTLLCWRCISSRALAGVLSTPASVLQDLVYTLQESWPAHHYGARGGGEGSDRP